MRAFVEHVETCDYCLDLMDDEAAGRITYDEYAEAQYEHFKATYRDRFNGAELNGREGIINGQR